MTRAIRVLEADPHEVLAALRDALTADGPAIFTLPVRGPDAVVPSTPALPGTVQQRIALVVETSGSTGRPKRVAITADALLASAAASASTLGGAGQWLCALPAHYIAGINVLVRSIAAQTEPVVLPSGHFDASAFVEAARSMSGDLRFTSLVPLQLDRLLAAGETDGAARQILRRFDRILLGGQAAPRLLLERADALGLHVTRSYGSSETSGGCVYDGAAIGSARIRIVDGEVHLGGPTLADGYLDDPERTEAAFRVSDGLRWYRTGDSGALVDGVLSVTGRLDRVIISGGVKLSLDAVESTVRIVPPFQDAVAMSVEDAEWGQSFILLTAGRPTDEERSAMGAALVERLGRAARPARVLDVPVLPTLPSGKPDLAAIRMLVADASE